MPEIVSNCLLCGGERSQLFDRRSFGGIVVENRICQSCGFVFQSPRMTAIETEEFYATEYRQLYQGSSGPNPKDLAIQKLRAVSLVSFVRKQVNEVTRLLDIGCSAGLLMQAFNQAFGCHPVGIEPGIAYREYAAKTGFRIFESLGDLQSAGEAGFDLINMAHVLEHLPNPVAYLVELREKILSPEGRLLIEVPNLYMHDSFEVAHLSSFSEHTLIQMIQKAGYDMVCMEKHGRPRSKILPYYLVMLCQPTSSKRKIALHRERHVRIKRQTGLLYRRIVRRFFPALAWRKLPDEKE
jgi:2-polyprenyl-3-methyl-5-hydroxy-6-metoxy-1,4-benzoquinol methylase